MPPSGCNVYETLGSGYTLLAFGTKAKVLKDFRDVAAELRMPLTIVQDDCKGEVERYQANLILIQPDQFVCWVAKNVELHCREAREGLSVARG